MNLIIKLKNLLIGLFFLFTCLFFLISPSKLLVLNALPMNSQDELITEELRLKVPNDFKDVWLKIEKNVWEPWLSNQDGFLGRQIFWDKKREEALILVKWKNRVLWKGISIEEVDQIQDQFEQAVKNALNVDENPFILIYEGELFKEG